MNLLEKYIPGGGLVAYNYGITEYNYAYIILLLIIMDILKQLEDSQRVLTPEVKNNFSMALTPTHGAWWLSFLFSLDISLSLSPYSDPHIWLLIVFLTGMSNRHLPLKLIMPQLNSSSIPLLLNCPSSYGFHFGEWHHTPINCSNHKEIKASIQITTSEKNVCWMTKLMNEWKDESSMMKTTESNYWEWYNRAMFKCALKC